MSNKTTVIESTTPLKNDVLCDGIRVRLLLAVLHDESFFIEPMKVVPRQGDSIDVASMIEEKRYLESYSDNEFAIIHSIIWEVWYVRWGKDKEGYFAELVCREEV